MFKLFYDNEHNIQDILKQSNFEDEFVKFNEDIKMFVEYNLNKIINDTNETSFHFIEAFVMKVISILDMNDKYNASYEGSDFVYVNIGSVLIENEKYIYGMFFKIFELQEYNNEDNNNNHHNESVLSKENENLFMQMENLLHKLNNIMNNYYKEDNNNSINNNNLYEITFSIFCQKYISTVIQNINKAITSKYKQQQPFSILQFIYYFIPYYHFYIQHPYTCLFKSFQYSEKPTIFLTSIIKSIYLLFPKTQQTSNENDTQFISTILSLGKPGYTSIMKMFSLCSLSPELITSLLNILLLSLPTYLHTESQQCETNFHKFLLFKSIENTFFNISNQKFYFQYTNIPNIIEQYHKIILETLTKTSQSNLNKAFISAIDDYFRLPSPSNTYSLNDTVLSYFDILPHYESFEWMFIHSLVNRAIDGVFDYMKEKALVEDLEKLSKTKGAYSYRLQTVINNIKMNRSDNINLIVLPYHTYHLYNNNCKPNYNKYLLQIFKHVVMKNKYPENSTLIFQQGYIEYESKHSKLLKGISIISDIIQFSVLAFIGDDRKKFSEIKNEIAIADDLLRFILQEMIKVKIIEFDDGKDVYWINSNMNINNTNKSVIDIRINYEVYFISGGNYSQYYNQIDTKYQHILWDCYVVKYLKNNKHKTHSIKDILTHLLSILPKPAINNLNEDTLSINLNTLVTKGFIIKTNQNTFKYI